VKKYLFWHKNFFASVDLDLVSGIKYQLAEGRRFVREKDTDAWFFKRNFAFYETQTFTLFTRTSHFSPSSNTLVQFTHSHSAYLRYSLILSYHLCLVLSSYPFFHVSPLNCHELNEVYYACNYFTNRCTIISLLYIPCLHVSIYLVIIRAFKIYQRF
jgi:hypothetical protein